MSQSPPASAALSPPRVLALLSDPRTAPYRDRFKPANDAELLGAYMWSQALSASFHPFVGFAEVVLRNAIHQTLSEQCSGGRSLSYAWYDRAVHGALPLRGKSLERVEEQLCEGRPPVRKVVQPNPDAMIASLSFGFWPNVMEGLSHRYAPHAFTKVFAYHPNSKPQHWSKDANKTLVVLRLKRLQDLRNRISHFEPIWKPHWLNIQAPHWSHSVEGLRLLHQEMLALLGWCSPDAVAAYKASFAWNWFDKLCTTAAVKAFMANQTNAGFLPSFSQNA